MINPWAILPGERYDWLRPKEEILEDNLRLLKIAEYLDKSKPRRHKLTDHCWNYQNLICAYCGISQLDFYAIPYGMGLPCGLSQLHSS